MRKFLIVAILSLFLLSACSSQQKYLEQTKPTQLILNYINRSFILGI